MAVYRSPVPLAYQPPSTIRWLPHTVGHFRQTIRTQAKRYNLNPDVVAIILTLESGGDPKADSGQARGLMQVTPPTAHDIATKYLKRPAKHYDLFDEKTSIEFGTAYVAHLRDTLCRGLEDRDCMETVAAGYNGGPGAALQLLRGNGLQDVQTATYARNAINLWRERGARTSPTFDRWYEAGGKRMIARANNHLNKNAQ